MTVETKRRIAELLLRCSASPAPIEISFVSRDHISPWRYPTPYDLHYGEEPRWREKFEGGLSGGEWKKWNDEVHTDKDLAAHITVTRRYGIVLYGAAIDQVFPSVPEEDYTDSLVEDFHWGRERMLQYPTNFILNTCRVLAYLTEKQILSKDEAGEWALRAVPEELKQTVNQALEAYRGNSTGEHFAITALEEFADYIAEEISNLLT
jgi:streptomycin 3"-adenylyltransferase